MKTFVKIILVVCLLGYMLAASNDRSKLVTAMVVGGGIAGVFALVAYVVGGKKGDA
jgi:hypothetical protein